MRSAFLLRVGCLLICVAWLAACQDVVGPGGASGCTFPPSQIEDKALWDRTFGAEKGWSCMRVQWKDGTIGSKLVRVDQTGQIFGQRNSQDTAYSATRVSLPEDTGRAGQWSVIQLIALGTSLQQSDEATRSAACEQAKAPSFSCGRRSDAPCWMVWTFSPKAEGKGMLCQFTAPLPIAKEASGEVPTDAQADTTRDTTREASREMAIDRIERPSEPRWADAREPMTRDEPMSRDEPMTRDEPTTWDEPMTRDEPARDEPSRDEPARDEPSRDEPARDEPARDEPMTRDEPARVESSVDAGPDTVAPERFRDIVAACIPGHTRSCTVPVTPFSVEPGEYKRGECNKVIDTCSSVGRWGGCNYVLPTPEICDGKDNNCNGVIDEGLATCTRKHVCPTGPPCVLTVVGPPALSIGREVEPWFNKPGGVVIDSNGVVYVADTTGHRIIRYDRANSNAERRVSVLAGNGISGHKDGDGYLAQFFFPRGLAVHKNTLYVADTGNHVIRAIDLITFKVSTVVGKANTPADAIGSGANARLFSPRDVAVDSSGNVFISDSRNRKVKRFSPQTGVVSLLITSLSFLETSGLAVDGGKVYIADRRNDQIWLYEPGKALRVIVKRGASCGASNPGVRTPEGLFFHGGTLYISSSNAKEICAYTPGQTNSLRLLVGGNLGTVSQLSLPMGVGVHGNRMAVVDWNSQRTFLYELNPLKSLVVLGRMLWGSSANAPLRSSLNLPVDVALSSGGRLAISELLNQRVLDMSLPRGNVSSYAYPVSLQRATDKRGIQYGANGDLFVSFSGAHAIFKYPFNAGVFGTPALMSGVVKTMGDGVAAGGYLLNQPRGLYLLGQDLFFADTGNHKIRKVRLAAQPTTTVAAGSSQGFKDDVGAKAQFYAPTFLDYDPSSKVFYISDTSNARIRTFDLNSGKVNTLIGANGSPTHVYKFDTLPKGIAFVPPNLLYATVGNCVLRFALGATFRVTKIAGNCSARGFRDGRTTEALFDNPIGIRADTDGNLYVADSINHRIRKVVLK